MRPLVDIRADCDLVEAGRLVVTNPVFPENFLEEWTNGDIAVFFLWLKTFNEDLSVEWDDVSKRTAGLKRILGDGVIPEVIASAPAVASVTAVKPWGVIR